MKLLIATALLLVLSGVATAIPIETVHYFNPPTGGVVYFTMDAIYRGMMREALVLDALLEWDDIVCTERYFILDYLLGTITIQWQDLGANGPLARTSAGSVTVNTAYSWYEGFGTPGDGQYDLLSVLKHEIGHAIGVNGDWGRLDSDGVGEEYTDTNGNGSWDPGEPYYDTNSNGQYDPDYVPPPYAHNDQLMWGFFAEKQTIRNVQYCDAKELEGAYTVHTPEPASFLAALGGAAVFISRLHSRRRRRATA